MCQPLNRHMLFPWWLASLSTEANLTNYPSLHKACMIDWWQKSKKNSFCFLVQLFFQTFLPQLQEWFIVIKGSFHPFYKNCPLVAESFLNFLNVSESSFLILSLMFPSKCSSFCETSRAWKFLQQRWQHHAKCHILQSPMSLIGWGNVLNSVWQQLLAAA